MKMLNRYSDNESSSSLWTEKCNYWTNLLKSNISPSGERSTQIMEILDNIFSSNCLFTSARVNEMDFSSLRNFLSPNGVLFTTIDQLLLESNIKFDLAFYRLHALSQQKLRSNEVSDFFRRIYDAGRGVVHVNAFEYLFYRFADNVYQRSVQDDALFYEGSLLEYPYSVLLQDYLFYFLPLDRSLAPYLEESTLHRGNYSDLSVSQPKRNIGLGLLKKEIYEKAIATPNDRSSALKVPSSSFLSKSWTLLQILCDVWVTNAQSTRADGFLTMLIRSIVKHVHRFAFRTSLSASDAQLVAFNDNIISRLLAPSLLKFFDFNFAKWPLDASFRTLLELWLAFIQPWRYADVDEHQESIIVHSRWEPFVDKYFIFYTKFLRSTFTRFIRTDLKAIKNAMLLYRVVRIFSQPNLLPMLKFVSQSRISNHQVNGSSGENMIFDSDFHVILYHLATIIQASYGLCQTDLNKLDKSSLNRTFTEKIINFFSDTETDAVRLAGELTKTCDYLEFSVNSLSQLFDLPSLREDVSLNISSSTAMKRQISNLSNVSSLGESEYCFIKPDSSPDRNGYLTLTPKGRFQIMNKLCSPDYCENYYSGTPLDVLPPRFDEISCLVKFFGYLDKIINRRYGENIEKLYNRSDVPGYLAKFLIFPPTADLYKSSPVSSKARLNLPARVSFRGFARIRFFLLYVLVLFILWLIFSVNPSCTFLCTVVLLFLFVVFIAFM